MFKRVTCRPLSGHSQCHVDWVVRSSSAFFVGDSDALTIHGFERFGSYYFLAPSEAQPRLHFIGREDK